MKVLVYLPEERLAPKGGPLAVGYYYFSEMKRRNDDILEFCHIDKISEDVHKKGRILTSKLPKWINNIHRTIRGIINRKNFLNGKTLPNKRDYSQYDMIHFHSTNDLYYERENLKNFQGKVLLQSHSPLPQWQEQNQHLSPWYERLIPNMLEKCEAIDRFSFDRADYVIFPCEEAEEPYFDNWQFFREYKTKNANKFRYVLTGIMPANAKKTRNEVLSAYDIPNDDFVISYVGRHNTVKGYDLLKEIASSYFNKDEHSWVVAAGLESPFSRLKHPRWKEIGFTNDPHSLIAASDVFVLPNRVTYFDIVMIEILSLGKIVIASRTGGNKFFEKQGVEGVLLYDSIEEAVNLLSKVKNLTSEEKLRLEESNKAFYNKMLSNVAMYDSYINLLNSLV